jgi:hypothetical protein
MSLLVFFPSSPYKVEDDMLLLFGWLIDEMVAHCLFSSMVVASKVWSTKMQLILHSLVQSFLAGILYLMFILQGASLF